MRVLGLLGVAAQAEGLRLRRTTAVTARRIGLRAAAAAFAGFALVTFHVAGWLALRELYGPTLAATGVAAADSVLAAIFLFLSRTSDDPVAYAASQVRDQSLREVRNLQMIPEVMSVIGWRSPVAMLGVLLVERVIKGFLRK